MCPTTSNAGYLLPRSHPFHIFAFDWALPRIGSNRVAFIRSPRILSLPPMNSDWAFAVPRTSLPKSSSARRRVTIYRQKLSATLPSKDSRSATRWFYVLLGWVLISLPFGFSPAGLVPCPTVPADLRSMYQLCSLPSLFLSTKAKMAPPFLMASFLSASLAFSASLMRSKAWEAGNAGSETPIVEEKLLGWIRIGRVECGGSAGGKEWTVMVKGQRREGEAVYL